MVLGTLLWTAALPCRAQVMESVIKFKNCDSLNVDHVFQILRIESLHLANSNVDKILVTCMPAGYVSLNIITASDGQTVYRQLSNGTFDTAELERVLALFIVEAVAEARQTPTSEHAFSAYPKNITEETVAKPPIAKLPVATSLTKAPNHRDRRRGFNGLGASMIWHRMSDIGALGPGLSFFRLHANGLGWQWGISTLFSKDSTAEGNVRTVIASTRLNPYLFRKRSWFIWRMGAGIRAGWVWMKGIPEKGVPLQGKSIAGFWYGPLVVCDIGITMRNVLLAAALDAGYAFASVKGRAIEKDIAVGGYWLRPEIFIAVVF